MKIALVGSSGFIGSNLAFSLNYHEDEFVLFDSEQSLWKSEGNLRDDYIECEAIIWAAGRVNPYLAELHPELAQREKLNLLE